jgi:hypothetical protein
MPHAMVRTRWTVMAARWPSASRPCDASWPASRRRVRRCGTRRRCGIRTPSVGAGRRTWRSACPPNRLSAPLTARSSAAHCPGSVRAGFPLSKFVKLHTEVSGEPLVAEPEPLARTPQLGIQHPPIPFDVPVRGVTLTWCDQPSGRAPPLRHHALAWPSVHPQCDTAMLGAVCVSSQVFELDSAFVTCPTAIRPPACLPGRYRCRGSVTVTPVL